MAVVAFIGLGQMGRPMSLNILRGGHSVQVFDVDRQAVEADQSGDYFEQEIRFVSTEDGPFSTSMRCTMNGSTLKPEKFIALFSRPSR